MHHHHHGAPARLAAVLLAAGSAGLLSGLVAPGELTGADARVAAPPRPTAKVAGHTDAQVLVGDVPVPHSRALPPGFVGFSFEYPALSSYAGSDPHAVDPVLVRLIRSVSGGARPVLRIGGDSTDGTWWPVGRHRPPGVTYALTPNWLAETRALLVALRARVIAGVDLRSIPSALGIAEARVLLAGLGRRNVQAIEIGNEPSNYSAFAAYRNDHRRVFARVRGYDYTDYVRDFDGVGIGLRGIPVAGPALGTTGWMGNLPEFLHGERALSLITFHRYALSCFAHRRSSRFASIPNLLSPFASTQLVAPVVRFAAESHAVGVPFRVDELGSVSCGGRRRVSDTFASALWALDTLFELDRAGADGVNIHSFPHARYAPFSFRHRHGRWAATVAPSYLGLLMFTRAAPPGARLLPVASTPIHGLKIWATRLRSGALHILLINKTLRRRLVVAVGLLGRRAKDGQVERLTAPSASASTGVTLGGQSFGRPTFTGRLTGTPTSSAVAPQRGRYRVTLPAASAALLTLPAP